MNRCGVFCLLVLVIASTLCTTEVLAERHADRVAARHALGLPWHSPYYHTATGLPVALVVPPTAHMQTNWSWGVSQDTMTPIYHQFRRSYPGEVGPGGLPLLPTPRWPSHTSQFGVNYIRGPY